MLPTMSGDKATSEPTVIFSQNEVSLPAKSRPYRKYVIIAAVAVVIAAIVLAAILVGMYLFTQAQKEILKFSYNRDENSKEDVVSDPNTNVVQYHVTDKDYELWVVDDFNRDIQVAKIKYASGTNCYVSPLNRTMATDPSKVAAPSHIKTQNESYTVTYHVSDSPIPDSTFLSKAARDNCKGISTYWVYPACDTPTNPSESSSRQKRGQCCKKVCWGWFFHCRTDCWNC